MADDKLDPLTHAALVKAASGEFLIQAPAGRGLFPGGQKTKPLADAAVANGLLVRREPSNQRANRAWSKTNDKSVGEITAAGLRKLAEANSPKVALESLIPMIRRVTEPPLPPDPAAFRTALDLATGECVGAIREAFERLERLVLAAVTPVGSPAPNSGPVMDALRTALARVEVPVTVAAPTPRASPDSDPIAVVTEQAEAAGEAILAALDDWLRERPVGCPFDQLFSRTQTRRAGLAIGTFHDALRKLLEGGRIRLTGWPKSPDEIPRPELALIAQGKVMYYASLPDRNG